MKHPFATSGSRLILLPRAAKQVKAAFGLSRGHPVTVVTNLNSLHAAEGVLGNPHLDTCSLGIKRVPDQLLNRIKRAGWLDESLEMIVLNFDRYSFQETPPGG